MARIEGTASDDTLTGTERRDVILGRGGDDDLSGLAGDDRLVGGDGRDQLRGGDGNDELSGGASFDGLYGSAGDDVLLGGAGDDYLFGGAGLDRVGGGAGTDYASFFSPDATGGVTLDLATGIVADDGFGNRESLTGIEGAYGGIFADALAGDAGANWFSAGLRDTVAAGGGDDRLLIGSVDGTHLDGGTGSDTIVFTGVDDHVDARGRYVTTYADHGIAVNLLRGVVLDDGFGASATIAGFENVDAGAGNDAVGGSVADNHLFGADGDDTLSGNDGADALVGGLGADTLKGGAGADVFGWGTDFEFLGLNGGDLDDVVLDFGAGDRLDIRPGTTLLTFIGTAAFTAADTHAIRYEIAGGDTYVFARSYDPGQHFDVTVRLVGVHALDADDFVRLAAASPAHHGPPLAPAELALA